MTRVDCTARVPPGGHGAVADVYLANHWFRAILRAPLDALSRRGVAGMTLIDAAPWGQRDALHEAIPQIDGAWLSIEEVTLERDAVRVRGTAVADGRGAEVRYVVDPEGPWITIEGADGLWLHVAGDAETWGEGAFLVRRTLIATEGSVTDLGGTVEVSGAQRLLVAEAAHGWTTRSEADGVVVSGVAPGAERLVWADAAGPRGRVPVTVDQPFELMVPRSTIALWAEARGRASSPPVPPGRDLELAVGPRGTVELTVTGPADDVRVVWSAADGREGTFLVRPKETTSLDVGAGAHHLELSAGPSVGPRALDLTLGADELRAVTVPLEHQFDPGPWVLAAFDGPSDRDAHFRGSNGTAAQQIAGEGVRYVVFAPQEVLPGVERDPLSPVPGEPPHPTRLAHQNGTRISGMGWSVSGWPWSDHPSRALYGGIQTTLRDPLEAAAAVHGGVGSARALRVDLGWLSQAGPPFLAQPRPDFVALDPPDPSWSNWAPWFDWLDAGIAVVPTGPKTWVPVPDPHLLGPADVEQPLFRGLVAAGSGPILELAVDGVPSGEVVPHRGQHTVRAVLRAPEAMDVALIGTGGQLRADLGASPVELDLAPGWVVAVAQGAADPERWVVTGPVWLVP